MGLRGPHVSTHFSTKSATDRSIIIPGGELCGKIRERVLRKQLTWTDRNTLTFSFKHLFLCVSEQFYEKAVLDYENQGIH